jgi:hypothetical protein
MLKTSGLQFDFELSRRSHGRVRAVEWPIGEGGAGTCRDTEKDQCCGRASDEKLSYKHVRSYVG